MYSRRRSDAVVCPPVWLKRIGVPFPKESVPANILSAEVSGSRFPLVALGLPRTQSRSITDFREMNSAAACSKFLCSSAFMSSGSIIVAYIPIPAAITASMRRKETISDTAFSLQDTVWL